MDQNVHELNITELRLKKRPLWMSDLGIDDYSDIVGGGGDIYNDRLPPAWPRNEGMELTEAEEEELGPVDIESFREGVSDRERSAKGGGHEADRPSEPGAGEKATVEAKVSDISAKVRKTAETATEAISGLVGSVKNIFRGK